MKQIYALSIYILCLLSTIPVFGNEGEASQWIHVINAESGEPIEGVSITGDNRHLGETGPLGRLLVLDFNEIHVFGFHHTSYAPEYFSREELLAQDFQVRMDESVLNIQEVVIRANRSTQDYSKLAKEIRTIDAKNKEQQFQGNAADVLGIDPNIFIQKSQSGGGSPMIRGMSTSRVLLLVDGVRMNNAIFRSGNVHNIISVDPESISNVEISLGPGSVIHGSDALGGVMQLNTYEAHYGDSSEVLQSLVFTLSHQSNQMRRRPNFRINYGGTNWAGMSSITYANYDDITMGKYALPWTPQHHLNNALFMCEPISFGTLDTLRKPADPYTQLHTNYEQLNLTQKFRVRLGPRTELKSGAHASLTSDITRYDRYIQTSGDQPKYAKWNYGPQLWTMGYVSLEDRTETKYSDYFSISLSGQRYEESRDVRKFGKVEGTVQEEAVNIGQFNLDLIKHITDQIEIQYGAEYLQNQVNSRAHAYTILNPDTSWSAQSRYADGSIWESASMFLSSYIDLAPDWSVNVGLRASSNHMHTPISFLGFEDDAHLRFLAPSGQLGLTYHKSDRKYFALLSTGFRAPNVDDASKVFDSEPGALVVPNANLTAERLYSAEIGGTQKVGQHWAIEGGFYYSYLNNALNRAPYTFNGQDSIWFDGEYSQVLAIQNMDYAWIWGYQMGVRSDLSPYVRWSLNWSHPFGKDSNGDPLRHVSPFNATSTVVFKKGKWSTNFLVRYNGEIGPEDMAPSEVSKDYMYAIGDDGLPYSPRWFTMDVHTSYVFNKNIIVRAGLENLMDVQYRPYSSGVAAPGRSVFVSMTGSI